MLAVKEETLEAAFKILCNALDSLIDEFEAPIRFRSIVCTRGVRIGIFFTLLWKEAKRAGILNRQVRVVLATKLPNKASTPLKRWTQEREDKRVTDALMREFIGFVEQNLRQMEVPLDFGASEA